MEINTFKAFARSDIYLGNGVYAYKVNETGVKNEDIPKLYRLSFPVSDNSPRTTGNTNGNSNSSDSLKIGGIHAWILGLACFVGCLLIMVVITVVFLARKWMSVSWEDRYCNHPIDDRDSLVVVEADPNGPKHVSNFSANRNTELNLNASNNSPVFTCHPSILNPSESYSLPAYNFASENAVFNQIFRGSLGTNLEQYSPNITSGCCSTHRNTATNSCQSEFSINNDIQNISNDFLPEISNNTFNNSLDTNNSYLQRGMNNIAIAANDSSSRNNNNNNNSHDEQIFENQHQLNGHREYHHIKIDSDISSSVLRQKNVVCDKCTLNRQRNDKDSSLINLARDISQGGCDIHVITCDVATTQLKQNDTIKRICSIDSKCKDVTGNDSKHEHAECYFLSEEYDCNSNSKKDNVIGNRQTELCQSDISIIDSHKVHCDPNFDNVLATLYKNSDWSKNRKFTELSYDDSDAESDDVNFTVDSGFSEGFEQINLHRKHFTV